VTNYRRALDLEPGDAEVHYNLAMALLAGGDTAAGWQEHGWRLKTAQLIHGRRNFAKPQWMGEAAEGQTLLIHAEQGFGDTIQFCRYAPLAAARGLRVILEVPSVLMRLLRGLPGVERMVVRGSADEPATQDRLFARVFGPPASAVVLAECRQAFRVVAAARRRLPAA